MKEEEIKKINTERKKKDKEVTEKNEQSYSKEQIKKKEEEVVKFKDRNDWKEKVVERVTYHNGVVKSRIVGMLKNGKLLYGKRPGKK